jgi:hypothetical protein
MSPYCIFEMLDACAESPKGREVSVVSAQFYFFLVGEDRLKLPFRQEVCRRIKALHTAAMAPFFFPPPGRGTYPAAQASADSSRQPDAKGLY